MSERKNLTITQVKEIEKVGPNQIPKLSFKAKDGEQEYWFQCWRSSLFENIKPGATIEAEIEVKDTEYGEQRKVTQIYIDGQPLGGKKGQFYRGKSPEELELSAKSYALSYAKDLAVAQVISLKDITKQADTFYQWLSGNGKTASPAKKKDILTDEQEFENLDKTEVSGPVDLTAMEFKNVGEFYQACLDHFKLAKSKVDSEIPQYDLTKSDQRKKAWQQILAVYGQNPTEP